MTNIINRKFNYIILLETEEGGVLFTTNFDFTQIQEIVFLTSNNK